DQPVADALVDRVRGRVGEVCVEEAEAAAAGKEAAVEQALRELRGERGRVAPAAELRWCVHGADADPIRRSSAPARDGYLFGAVFPEEDPGRRRGEPVVDVLLGALSARTSFVESFFGEGDPPANRDLAVVLRGHASRTRHARQGYDLFERVDALAHGRARRNAGLAGP